MKHLLIITVFRLIFTSAIFSEEDFNITLENLNQRFVAPKSGLFLREKPRKNSMKITLMPYNAKILIIEETSQYIDLDEVYGNWVKVIFQEQVGWAFGGFLRHEVQSDKMKKHWNRNRSMYFIVSSNNGVLDCGAIYSNDSCKLQVFKNTNELISSYSNPISSSGWIDDRIVISSYGADGGGGGLYQELWNPTTNKKSFYFFWGVSNNSESSNESKIRITQSVCIKTDCYFLDDDEANKIGYLYEGKNNIKKRLIKKYFYKQKITILFINKNSYILIDDILKKIDQ